VEEKQQQHGSQCFGGLSISNFFNHILFAVLVQSRLLTDVHTCFRMVEGTLIYVVKCLQCGSVSYLKSFY